MAQKRKSLKKSFRKSNRSTRRKSKTNKRKSRKIRGGDKVKDVSIKFNEEINRLDSKLSPNPPTDLEELKDAQDKVKALIYYKFNIGGWTGQKCESECKKRIEEGFVKLRDVLVKKVFTTQDEIDTYRREAIDHSGFAVNQK